MKDRTADRNQAYQYIVNQFKTTVNWIPPIDSDKKLAEFFDIPVSEIVALKNGLIDPPEKVILQFKNLVERLVAQQEIDNYLISPFSNND